ncbi:penicillin-binding protein activator, partial [Acinetobacter baumannii]
RLAPRLPELKAVPSLQIDGLTGTLSLNPTQRIERQLQWAEFRTGQVQPLGTSSFCPIGKAPGTRGARPRNWPAPIYGDRALPHLARIGPVAA